MQLKNNLKVMFHSASQKGPHSFFVIYQFPSPPDIDIDGAREDRPPPGPPDFPKPNYYVLFMHSHKSLNGKSVKKAFGIPLKPYF